MLDEIVVYSVLKEGKMGVSKLGWTPKHTLSSLRKLKRIGLIRRYPKAKEIRGLGS